VQTTRESLTARDVAALVVINLLWGSSYVVTKGALATIPALPLACARFTLAWVAFALLAWVRRPNARASFTTEARRARRSTRREGFVGAPLVGALPSATHAGPDPRRVCGQGTRKGCPYTVSLPGLVAVPSAACGSNPTRVGYGRSRP
jgi:hypothetical protein